MAETRNSSKQSRKRKFEGDIQRHQSKRLAIASINETVPATTSRAKATKYGPLATIKTESDENYLIECLSSASSELSPNSKVVTVSSESDDTEFYDGKKKKKIIQLDAKPKRLPCSITSSCDQRVCTLPKINFADAHEVWKLMCRQDEKGSLLRDPNMLNMHNGLHPRMRAILLDWLIEVCEVYKMRRETYYLAVDYLDRYLTNVVDCIPKNHLQLIGVTCLFIAAKVEEIYPPKISEFSYITDGACSDEDILNQELVVLSTLQWNMSPTTVIGWVSLYMQINVTTNITVPPPQPPPTTGTFTRKKRKSTADRLIAESKKAEAFVYPQFSGLQYTQVAQLADLCSLDVEMASFPYSVIAAAAISHIFDKKTAIKLSGLDWDVIAPCSRWIEPFYQVLTEESNTIFLLEQNEQISSSSGLSHLCQNIQTDESHTIQTHNISMKMFDEAISRREKVEKANCQEDSPVPGTAEKSLDGLLTPPTSNQKSFEHTETNQTVALTKSNYCQS